MLMLSRILIFGLLVSNLFGNDRWSSNIDYKEVIAKAQSGSAYFQGLLGIYLRSGESWLHGSRRRTFQAMV